MQISSVALINKIQNSIPMKGASKPIGLDYSNQTEPYSQSLNGAQAAAEQNKYFMVNTSQKEKIAMAENLNSIEELNSEDIEELAQYLKSKFDDVKDEVFAVKEDWGGYASSHKNREFKSHHSIEGKDYHSTSIRTNPVIGGIDPEIDRIEPETINPKWTAYNNYYDTTIKFKPGALLPNDASISAMYSKSDDSLYTIKISKDNDEDINFVFENDKLAYVFKDEQEIYSSEGFDNLNFDKRIYNFNTKNL